MKTTAQQPSRGHEAGVALPLALIILAVMILAAISLVRSVDTATLVSANLAMRQRAAQAGEQGIRDAFRWIQANTGTPVLYTTDTAVGFYSSQHASDPNWDPVTQWPAGTVNSTDTLGNSISYVIHRLCTQPDTPVNGSIALVQNVCVTYTPTKTSGGAGGTMASEGAMISGGQSVYLRITVRVRDNRNTTSYLQAMVLAPVT